MGKSLSELHPELAKEWHPTKNGDLLPTEISPKAPVVVWWLCNNNPPHQWQAAVYSRANSGSGCPNCKRGPKKPLAEFFPEIAKEWHPTKNLPLTVGEVGTGTEKRVWWRCLKNPSHEWQAYIFVRTQRPQKGCPICSGWLVTPETSLAGRFPEIAKEWHPEKNGELRPDALRPGAAKRVWWRCTRSPLHEWQAYVFTRTKTGTRCPFCVGSAAGPDNSLAALYPKLLEEWHPTKNGDLSPHAIRPGSEFRAWWRCSKDPSHEWQAIVGNRTHNNNQCPMCVGRVATPSTSLQALFPQVAKEWHPTKNGRRSPKKTHPGSHTSAWWRCARDPSHEWESVIAARTRGTGCPFCAMRRVGPSNSLATRHPELAKEWHPTKNKPLTPDQVVAGGLRVVWWQCKSDRKHQWKSPISSRVRGTKCPFCSGRLSVEDIKRVGLDNVTSLLPKRRMKATPETCLSATHPELAKEWHPKKNHPLTPDQILSGSGRRVWWQCLANPEHEWQAYLTNRAKGTGCPFCFKASRKKAEGPRKRHRRRKGDAQER